jgi:hypothetical protein
VEGSCEHGNEPSVSIECCEILEELHNWQLHKKCSAPWSFLIGIVGGGWSPNGYTRHCGH